MTNDELRMTNVEKSCGLSRFRRFCAGFVILSLVPMFGCGRHLARNELRLNDYYSEILKRVDRGWIGDDRFFEDNLLVNPDPEVRRWCAIALGRIGSPGALPLLYRAVHTGDAAVRAASAFSIGAIENRDSLEQQYLLADPQAVAELKPLLDDPSISVRMRAIEALGKIGSRSEAEEIVRRLETFQFSGSAVERAYLEFAVTALARLKDPAALPVLERLANASDSEIQWRALEALVAFHDEKAVPLYIRKLESANPADQANPDQQNHVILVAEALGEIGSGEAEPVLLPLLKSTQPVANSAVIALSKILKGNPARFFGLVDKSRFTAPAALPAWIQAMGNLGGDEAEEELRQILVRELRNPTRPGYELIPGILRALAKFNPPGLQEIISPFLTSRNAALLRTAVDLYQPKNNTKEPWAPIVQAFANCGDSETRIDALLHLTPWIGEPKVQQVLQTGLQDPERRVRLAALALLRKGGITGATGDPGPSAASVTDAVCRTLAASRKNSTIAIIETTRGTLELELFREDAPLTVANFVLMAKGGVYNGFVFEQGIPSQRIGGMNFGSQARPGRATNGEINMRPFERGSVGMTAAGGKRDTGRFFITLAPKPFLDGIDICFGRVISGIQVADKIVPGDRILRINIKETIGTLDRIGY